MLTCVFFSKKGVDAYERLRQSTRMNTTIPNSQTAPAGQNSSIIDEVIANHSPNVRMRARIEALVCLRLLTDLMAAGYWVSIDDGEETTLVNAHEEIMANPCDAMRLLFNLDEATLRVRKHGSKSSFVYLVFGNDGWDTISDYGVSLDHIIEPIYEWLDAAQEKGTLPALS